MSRQMDLHESINRKNFETRGHLMSAVRQTITGDHSVSSRDQRCITVTSKQRETYQVPRV